MSFFDEPSDEILLADLIKIGNPMKVAKLISEKKYYSVGSGGGKSIHRFGIAAKHLAKILIIEAAQHPIKRT